MTLSEGAGHNVGRGLSLRAAEPEVCKSDHEAVLHPCGEKRPRALRNFKMHRLLHIFG